MKERLLATRPFHQNLNFCFASGDGIGGVVRKRGVTVEILDPTSGKFARGRISSSDAGRVVANPAKSAWATRLRFVAMATLHDQILSQKINSVTVPSPEISLGTEKSRRFDRWCRSLHSPNGTSLGQNRLHFAQQHSSHLIARRSIEPIHEAPRRGRLAQSLVSFEAG
jgi:hypothetical protein